MAEGFARELQPKFIVKLKNTFQCMYHFLEFESAKMINERYFGVSALQQIKFSFLNCLNFQKKMLKINGSRDLNNVMIKAKKYHTVTSTYIL